MSTEQLSPMPVGSALRWFWPVTAALLAFTVVFGVVRMWPTRSETGSVRPREMASSEPRRIAGIDKGSFTAAGERGAPQAAGIANTATQAAFLKEAARRESGEWAALSMTERAEKRAELKASMLEER